MEAKKEIFQFASKSREEILKEFQVSLPAGLPYREAKARLQKYGPNKIEEKLPSWWEILFRQFRSAFIYLLIIAALITLVVGEFLDGLVILLFVSINTFLGFFQEYRSEQALKLLQQYVTLSAQVRREGQEDTLDSTNLVPGDLVILDIGDTVPADIRLLEAENLTVDESVLTGESTPVDKIAEKLEKTVQEIYQAQNLVFTGTNIVNGRGLGIVLATGEKTLFGKIAHLATKTLKESNFAKGLGRFSKFILRLIVVTIVLVFVANLLIKGRGTNLGELITFSLALAVSVIPEALPVVTTASLSRGALRLAKKKVVARRLSAIEDLGGIEILCTDKTGTLTENVLKVEDVYALNNEAIFYGSLASSPEKIKTDPFDLALAEKITPLEKERNIQFQRVHEDSFDPKIRRNRVLLASKNENILIVRGAAEDILSLSMVSFEEKNRILEWVQEKGRRGNRVLAVAKKVFAQMPEEKIETLENNLTFLGALSFTDPVKEDAFQAISKARGLGVQIKIITGDSPEVAGAVAEKIGLAKTSEVITGEQLMKMTIPEQEKTAENFSVFARVLPEQKFHLVEILQKTHQVGFLGEGINDAPALKIAGVSLVVQKAAHIARESADIILLEKDLRVIIDGIHEGREVFANTLKYLKATLTSNFGNFYAVAIASLFINFLPMLPLQILLLNLLSDFPMISIAADNVDPQEISRPQKYQIKEIIYVATILGLVSTIFDFIFFVLFYRISPGVLQTNWFIGSILTELVLLFSIRTKLAFWKARRPSALVLWLTGLAFLITIILPLTFFGQKVFHFVAPTTSHILLILGIVATYFICTETIKVSYYKLTNSKR